jgi:Ca2+-binding RTX toxin-like protein
MATGASAWTVYFPCVDVARWSAVVLLSLASVAVPSSQADTAGSSQARVKQGVKAEVKRGTLRITGDRRANKVTLRLKRRRRGVLEVDVRSNGSADFRFRRNSFRRIVMRGGRGNDALAISERNGGFITAERTTLDGGRGRDRLTFTGSGRADSLALSASRRRLRLARGTASAAAAATFSVAAGSVERVSVNPLGGSDTIALSGLRGTPVASVALQLGSRTGGDGAADTVAASGTAAPDALVVAGAGSSFSLGGIGPAVSAANLEPGQDRVTVNGLGGADTLHVTGSDAPDSFDARAAGALVRTVLGGVAVESDDVEALRLNALGGADTAMLGGLGGTDLGQVAVDLSGPTTGTADGLVDDVTVNGSEGADNVAVAGNASGISISGLAVPTSVVATDPPDRLTVNGLAGADTISASGLAANAALLTMRGGPDADTLTGGPADETFRWDPGDGNDVIGGGLGNDNVAFNGSEANEQIAVGAGPAGHALITRDVDAVTLDLDDVEALNVAPGAGSDAVNVGDMPGAELTQVGVNFGGADGQTDTAIATATINPEVINVTPTPTGASVALAPTTSVSGAELGRDTLTINALAGDDTVNASTVPAGLVDLVLQGGLGEDVYIGSQGTDLFQGGDGDDVGLMGAGDDTFVWNPGDDNDTIEGQNGADRLRFNGANIAENIQILPNGGRVLFLRDIANVTMDCNDVEIMDFNALGGADTITVNDLVGTDVTQVNLALAGAGGVGDAAADNVILNGTNGNDSVTIFGGPGGVNATGLMPGLAITGAEAANDRLTVNGLAGDDTINAAGVRVGAILLTLNGGANNDTLTGGDGDDTISGGDGNDFLKGGPGTDTLDGGPGINTVIQD